MTPVIVLPDKTPFDLDTLIKIVGYQIENKFTGRLLPTCFQYEIYTKNKMFIKLHEVISIGMIPYDEISDWGLVPITDVELENVSGYIIVN